MKRLSPLLVLFLSAFVSVVVTAARAGELKLESATIAVLPIAFQKGTLTAEKLTFFNPAFSEPKLLGDGYDFEPATSARAHPKITPVLAIDTIAF